MNPSNHPSNQYPGQRSLSSTTNTSQSHSYPVPSEQVDQSSQRHPYGAAYQQQMPNTVPQSGYTQAYHGQMHASPQNAAYGDGLGKCDLILEITSIAMLTERP